MDSNNVLSITFNSDELDKDLYNWSLLSKDLRKISDDNCIKQYGCKNRELYNKLKSKILFNKPVDQEILAQVNNTVVTNESYDYDNIDKKDLIYRIGLAKSMNNSDILIAIIYPYDPELISDSTYKETYKVEFNEIYNKFIRLNDKYQKYSNLYSIRLFGYNVRSMYQLIYPDLIDEKDTDNIIISRDYVDSNISVDESYLTEDLVTKNVISLFNYKILHCTNSINEASIEGIYSKSVLKEVNQYILSEFDNSCIADVVPYFTLSEYDNILRDNNLEGIDFDEIESSREYFKIITELYYKFNRDKDEETKNKLLEYAWNPYVDPRKYMNKVRDRQIKYFKENSCKIINLSNYTDSISSIKESSIEMNNLYKSLNIYPVFIILSYTNTTFGHIIRKIKGSTFTHAGISLDSDLSTILTFMFRGKKEKGFMIESLEKYLEIYKDAQISILCLFVDGDTLDALEDNISYFTTNKGKTHYNFKNLINILRNKAKDNDPYNLTMICSQFVDTILKLSGIDITHKSSNLVIPQDFEDIKNAKVYNLYTGLGKKYNELQVESLIYSLLTQSNPENVKYNELVHRVTSNSLSILTNRFKVIDNQLVESTLNDFYNLISVKPITKNTSKPTSNSEYSL